MELPSPQALVLWIYGAITGAIYSRDLPEPPEPSRTGPGRPAEPRAIGALDAARAVRHGARPGAAL